MSFQSEMSRDSTAYITAGENRVGTSGDRDATNRGRGAAARRCC